MNEQRTSNWVRRLNYSMLIALIIAITLNFYGEYKKHKLNQRYAKLIEQQEQEAAEFSKTIDLIQNELRSRLKQE